MEQAPDDQQQPAAGRRHRRRARWREITGWKSIRDLALFLLGAVLIVREAWTPPADPSVIITGLTLAGLPAVLSRDERPPRE
ncbi:hypothetical protein HUT16_27365 [Kitasatospora sp. NA04385]|uniref:hypothetical protein n=1 Tax=Kitasatospora sp. NA04385 TaxID=2742135 RepID=UPI0015912EB3|nr:hypothetical protein [Kitasatospora sp. NA04385]QKW22300.1 hypothetical protein HUT16_27365 [Kitasatospora sp. NA04385]